MNPQDMSRLSATIIRLRPHDHLCLIYETREEQFATVVPFIKAGLERRESMPSHECNPP